MNEKRLGELAARIRLLMLDVDGVLTDGGLYYLEEGGFAVRFDIKDGLGLARAVREGILVALVSGRDTPQARRRAEELGILEIHLGARDKVAVLEDILSRTGLGAEEACFVGDDLIDLPAMRRVGLPVAVADAVEEVREVAVHVTVRAGGRGAVREVVELLLSHR
ncbi:MAG: HAD hydrolase family protein [Acidobacteriota bacterium]|nr:HAD hydrolase family protein [Acidobacteriota bacterium]